MSSDAATTQPISHAETQGGALAQTQPRSIRELAVHGVAWTLAQKWATRLATFLTFVLLARLLDPRDFGIVAIAAAFLAVLNPLSNNGSSDYLVQARDIDQRTISTAFWSVMAISLLLSIALVVSAPLWAALLDTPDLAPVLQVMALSLFLHGLSSTQVALLKRRLQFRALAVRSLASVVVSSVVAISIAFAGGGVWSLVGQNVAVAATSAIVLWSSTGWRPSATFDKEICLAVFRYGSQVSLSSIVSGLRAHADSLIIAVVLGPVAVGYWAIAKRVLDMIVDTGVSVVSTVATPVFARLKDDPRRLRMAYLRAISTSLSILTPVLLTIAITSPVLVPLVFGEAWVASGELARIITLSGIAMVSLLVDRGLLLALNRPGTELLINVGSTAFGLVLVAAVSSFGLTAVAIAFALRAFVAWPVRLRFSSRLIDLDVRQFLVRVGLILTSAAVSGLLGAVAFVMLQRQSDLLAAAVVPPVLLAVSIAMMKALNPDLWDELRGLTQRRPRLAQTSSQAR